jgi:ABC-2 type transport system ATP-binding protein
MKENINNIEPPLVVRNINKTFKNRVILNNLNLTISKGDIYGLIGVNGAGKTTLIKIILDLLKSSEGKINIFGNSSLDKLSRKNVFYLPEKFQPSQYLTGMEFLNLSNLYFHNKAIENKKKILKYAKLLDLEEYFLTHKVNKYSKGMGQKLGLISVFLSEAPLLILDEPMSGLDPHVRLRLKEMLREYTSLGKTVFFSSHILSDIDEICNKISVIHKNKLTYNGSPQGFKKTYKSKTLELAFLKVIDA